MSFVPGFEYDIFISYAHDDNPPIGASRGWVEEFHESLENWLGKRRGLAGLTIWRDPRLDGNTDFDVAIQHRLQSSALLFVLQSRNYTASDYCRKELRYFYDQCRAQPAGVRVGERLRILNLLLNNIPHTEWPDELKVFGAASGFPMNDAASDDERGDLTSVASTLFETQLRKVVDATEATLRDLGRTVQAPPPVPETPDPPPVRIFLADVAKSLEAVRERLVADLAGHAQLLGRIPPPGEREPHRRCVEEALAGADLSLHLLDEQPGTTIVDDPTRTYPREQIDVALPTLLPTLIWVRDDLATDAVADVEQRALLRRLEDGERGTQHYEFVRCNRVALGDVVQQKVTALRDRLSPSRLSFLVDTHQKDQRYAYKLADLLADKGLDVAFNRESADPIESLSNFQRAVMAVRNLIVMYGRVGEPWLKRRIQVALKVVAEQFQSESPANLEAIWICLLPESASPMALRMPTGIIRINLLDNTRSDGIEPTIVTELLGSAPVIVEPAPEARNPFVGLRPFESEDSLYFFGRDIQSRDILTQLHRNRFVAVVGSSGSGKSSLIRASVVPRLEAGFLVQDRDAWMFATMKPGEAPLENLARALLRATATTPDRAAVDGLVDRMRRQGVEALHDLIAPHLRRADANLLLLVDQFEEIFRFTIDVAHGPGAQDAAELVRLMLALSEHPDIPAFVCLTTRSDFLGDCDTFSGLPEAMNRSQYLVPRLTRKERRDAITGPVHLTGVEIAPRLVDRLLNENIGTRDDLPVLQHALLRTWDAWAETRTGPIDVEHYERIGTIQNALSQDADAALRELSPDHVIRDDAPSAQQLLAKKLFQALTTVDASNRRVRRPVHVSDVAESAGARPGDIRAVIERFRTSGRSFLVLSSDDPSADPLIDISHESLIRQWRRLNDWVDEELASARVYQRLADTADLHRAHKAGLYHDPDLGVALDWRDKAKPTAGWARRYHGGFDQVLAFLDASRSERERDREAAAAAERARITRLRVLVVGLAVGLGVAAAVTLVVLRQRWQLAEGKLSLASANATLETQKDELARKTVDLEKKNAALDTANSKLDERAQRLVEQTKALEESKRKVEETNQQLASSKQTFKDTIDIGIRALDNDPKAKRDFDTFIRKNAKVFYAVYVWIFDETQQQAATDIGTALTREGYTLGRVPILWKLDRAAWIAKTSTVFYYNRYSKSEAEAIATLMTTVTGSTFRATQGHGFGVANDERRWSIIVQYVPPVAGTPAADGPAVGTPRPAGR